MQNRGLLTGLARTLSHCLSPTDMAPASGSQALLSVLDEEERGGPSANGGTPMHTENGDHSKTEEDASYGEPGNGSGVTISTAIVWLHC